MLSNPVRIFAGLSAVLLGGAVLTATTSYAAPAAPAAPAAAPEKPAPREVMLPTGDRVWVTGTGAAARLSIRTVATSGLGQAMKILRTPSGIYVTPVDAQPYLGTVLDRELFNVTRPPARPVLTPSSARAFGRALTAQWQAGRPAGGTLLATMIRMSSTLPKTARKVTTPQAPAQAQAQAKNVKLNVVAIGADGKPEPTGEYDLVDTNNMANNVDSPAIKNGHATATLPKGNYSIFGDEVDKVAGGGQQIRLVSVTDVKVTRTGQTVTLDYRRADTQPAVTVPLPSTLQTYSFDWTRFDPAADLGFGEDYLGAKDVQVFVAPFKAAKVGSVQTSDAWQLTGPESGPAYTYDLVASSDHVDEAENHIFTAKDLATVSASYYSDGVARNASFDRAAAFVYSSSVTQFQPVALGTRRTEYVGSTGTVPYWTETLLTNGEQSDFDDAVVETMNFEILPPGSTEHTTWLRGPLGAGIPQQDAQNGRAYCFACRGRKTISIDLSPALDSTPDHVFFIDYPQDDVPIVRFRLYRDGKKIADLDDVDQDLDPEEATLLGGTFPTVQRKAAYKVVADVDRRLQNPNESTISHTVFTFDSAQTTAGRLPSDWTCGASQFNCRALPVLQAKLALPLSLDGRLPAGPSTLTLSAKRSQFAARSAVAKARLWVRFPGADWHKQTLSGIGGGKFTTTVNNAGHAGEPVDVRMAVTDRGGSTVDQTIVHAYYVAGPAVAAAAQQPNQNQNQNQNQRPNQNQNHKHPACNVAAPGLAACMSTWRSEPQPGAGLTAAAAAKALPFGLAPKDLRKIYRLPKKGPKGQTIALIDAYGYPKAEHDLAVYRKMFKLPACTTANKCLRKVSQSGSTKKLPRGDAGWATETALDLQAVSAACPSCRILLVEAKNEDFGNLGKAVNTAVRLGADVVSNSYGAPEFQSMPSLAKKYFTHPKVPILASSGDDGYGGASFPAALSKVWAIGGTELTKQKSGSWDETAWKYGGSGCSQYVAKPARQRDTLCTGRAVADISAVADSYYQFAVYDTYGLGDDNGWIGLSGTSLSSPLVAAMIGLAGNAAKVADPAYAYRHPSGFRDITAGTNGHCGTPVCAAGPGYDTPTGLGVPKGLKGL